MSGTVSYPYKWKSEFISLFSFSYYTSQDQGKSQKAVTVITVTSLFCF